MTLFWIIAAAMIVLALAMVAPTLLRQRQLRSQDRDGQNIAIAREHLAEIKAERERGTLSEEEYEQSRQELEQTLLTDLNKVDEAPPAEEQGPYGRLALGILALVVPALTLVLYFYLGSPQLLEGDRTGEMAETGHGGETPSIEEMVLVLRQRLEQNPQDPKGWYMLGRTYMIMERYPQAAEAFEQVYRLIGDEPNLMLALADALAMSQGGAMQGRPADLIRKAVALDPENITGLWMVGLVEEEEGNFDQALARFRQLEPLLEGDQESQQQIRLLIARVEEKMANPAAASAPAAKKPVASGSGRVTLKVSLSSELRDKVGPGETLFIYIKALDGRKAPLAAVRYLVKDLPLEVALDDSDALTPDAHLSGFSKVLAGARISRSGNAIPRSGDLFGEVSPVTVGGPAVELVIDSTTP